MDRIVGRCGHCSGPVVVPRAWSGVIEPTPYCRQCGAMAVPEYGPVVPMMPMEPRPAVIGPYLRPPRP